MYEYKAYVRAVYDGDTITVDVDLGFGVTMTRQKIRLKGIDTPELRGGTSETKAAAKKSRDRVRGLILGRPVTVKTFKDRKGKFGRWIGEVYLSTGECVNELLVEEGLAIRKEY